MITFYTGIPRSGKTLKTVHNIYYEFIYKEPEKKFKFFSKKNDEKKEDKYLYLCTNINQFNFDLSHKFYKLNFTELYKNLEILYKMYLLHKNDDEIIEKAKELKLYKVLFVFDECHNFFKEKKDDVLVWWLTYHGHLYHDIILITQDMSLLSKEYKSQGEQFYRAIPQTYRLSKKVFKYSLYSSFHMYQKDYIKSITIKPTDEIFNLYVSGDSVNSKSILHKYIYLLFTLFILCIFAFMFAIDSLSPDVEKVEKSDINNIDVKNTLKNDKQLPKTEIDSKNINSFDTENLQLYKIRIFGNFCQIEFNNNIYQLPVKFYKMIVKDIDYKYFYFDMNTKNLYYLLADKNLFNFLIIEKKEKDEKNTNPIKLLG
jgi:zona occludens toxin